MSLGAADPNFARSGAPGQRDDDDGRSRLIPIHPIAPGTNALMNEYDLEAGRPMAGYARHVPD